MVKCISVFFLLFLLCSSFSYASLNFAQDELGNSVCHKICNSELYRYCTHMEINEAGFDNIKVSFEHSKDILNTNKKTIDFHLTKTWIFTHNSKKIKGSVKTTLESNYKVERLSLEKESQFEIKSIDDRTPEFIFGARGTWEKITLSNENDETKTYYYLGARAANTEKFRLHGCIGFSERAR